MRFSTPSSSFPLATTLQWLGLLVAAGAAGQFLAFIELPAGQFLGPMLVAILFAVGGCSIRVPRVAFKCGQGVIGLVAAHAISATVLVALVDAWPVMLLSTAITIGLSLMVGLLMTRYGDLPGTTAVWGSTPGAASAMVAMAEDYGADSRVVATMQYVRVVCVVLIGALVSHFISGDAASHSVRSTADALSAYQWLAFLGGLAVIAVGVLLGERIPAGALLVPLILGATLQLAGILDIVMPAWLLSIAMGSIGCYVGLRFDRPTVLYVMRRLPTMIACSLLLIGLCALCAVGIAALLDKDYLSVYLATSPGGLDSMAIIAVDTHADVSLVLAMQTLRLFAVILLGPFLVKRMSQWSGR